MSKRRPCNQDCYLGWGSCLPLLNFLLVVKADGLGISLVSKVTGSLAILYLGKGGGAALYCYKIIMVDNDEIRVWSGSETEDWAHRSCLVNNNGVATQPT